MDVILTTRTNPLWLARCKASLRNYLPPDCLIRIESDLHERSWLDNMFRGLRESTSELVFVIQDDAQLMPLRAGWMDELAKPFADDPFVAVSCMTATSVGYPHQAVRMAMPPGPYYTSMFIPIAFMARREVLLEVLTGIPLDLYCDHEPSLKLLMAGYKIVMNTHLPCYHEGMQTNLRVNGGDDPKAYMDKAKQDTIDYIRAKYPPIWIQRMEALEMVPMQNYLAKTAQGIEVRL